MVLAVVVTDILKGVVVNLVGFGGEERRSAGLGGRMFLWVLKVRMAVSVFRFCKRGW